jgi:hypothetical protein
VISLAVGAAGWVGFRSPGDYAALQFPPLSRHDRLLAEQPLTFSLRRKCLDVDAGQLIEAMIDGLVDRASPENDVIADKIRALPLPQRIAILDTVDRYMLLHTYWGGCVETGLRSLGVVFAESAHDEVRALRSRRP